METRRPLIVDVRRASLADGPGIRTVVFFKGCPLRCVFCHNPETQLLGPELAFAAERCLQCGACAQACPREAIDLDSPARVDRARCDLCGQCADVCPPGALRLVGKYWPVESLANLLLRDVAFYRHSGGGVTLSGGECTLFPDYLEALLQRLKARHVHVALETSGSFDYGPFQGKILPYLDLVLFDVKQPGLPILENLRKLLSEAGVEVRPRIPLIPAVTDSKENLEAIFTALRCLGAHQVELLPYNPLGLEMYPRLGRPEPDLAPGFVKPERERELLDMIAEIVHAPAWASPSTLNR
jgi:pyruvate formate lyase activating enzyme